MWPELNRARRAIVVVDVVESVRVMQTHEADFIDRWRRYVNEVVAQVLPAHRGRLVKSLGDGLLLEFEGVPSAVSAAFELQRRIPKWNEGRAADAAIYLRIGAHVADVVIDSLDVYGSGVNLAARLATLAQPGEIVVSAEVRDGLTDGVDADLEDLGECQLKHIAAAVRAFRLGPAAKTALPAFDTLADSRPTIMVLPLRPMAGDEDASPFAELTVADAIRGLSLTSNWRVISRLSAVAYRGRQPSLYELRERVQASYVLSGTCRVVGSVVRLNLELAEVRTEVVLWAGVIEGGREDVLRADDSLATRVVDTVASRIFAHEFKRSSSKPMQTLASHTLLFAAISLMHRMSRNDFERARAMLEHLVERHPRAPEPHAWLAAWHLMKCGQGWSAEIEADTKRAEALTQRALDQDSEHALSLAIDGLVAGYLRQDLERSQQRYEEALTANPNEALAWLFMSALHVYRGRGPQAAVAAQTALHLSPLDPLRYYYDTFAAHAMLSAGRLAEAVVLAQRSLRANGIHVPTYRSLAIAQVLLGDMEAAQATVLRLLQLDPSYTLSGFEVRNPGHGTEFARKCSEALRSAGLPLG